MQQYEHGCVIWSADWHLHQWEKLKLKVSLCTFLEKTTTVHLKTVDSLIFEAISVNLAVRSVTLCCMWNLSWSLFSLACYHVTRSWSIWVRPCCSIVKAMKGTTVRRLVIGYKFCLIVLPEVTRCVCMRERESMLLDHNGFWYTCANKQPVIQNFNTMWINCDFTFNWLFKIVFLPSYFIYQKLK